MEDLCLGCGGQAEADYTPKGQSWHGTDRQYAGGYGGVAWHEQDRELILGAGGSLSWRHGLFTRCSSSPDLAFP